MTMQQGDILLASQEHQNVSGTKRSGSGMEREGYSSASGGNKRSRVESQNDVGGARSSHVVNVVEDRTIELESLSELLSVEESAAVNSSTAAAGAGAAGGVVQELEQHTVQLEGGLGPLLQEFDAEDRESDDSDAVEEEEEEEESYMDMEGGDQPTRTIELEGGMVSLIANMSRDATSLGVDEDDHTVELEQGLGSLLDGLSSAASLRKEDISSAAKRQRNAPGVVDSPAVTSPSTPARLNVNVPVTSSRKTPVPQPVTLATISRALQVGNALELEVLDHEQLDKLASELGTTIATEGVNEDTGLLLQRRESVVKVALLLKERCMGLHTKLRSRAFRVGLQKFARIFLNDKDSQVTEEMSRAAALFMAVARAEARVDWATQATEIENVFVEALGHSAAVVSSMLSAVSFSIVVDVAPQLIVSCCLHRAFAFLLLIIRVLYFFFFFFGYKHGSLSSTGKPLSRTIVKIWT